MKEIPLPWVNCQDMRIAGTHVPVGGGRFGICSRGACPDFGPWTGSSHHSPHSHRVICPFISTLRDRGLVSTFQGIGRLGGIPLAVQLGTGTAGLFCPTSPDSMSVSLTWLCCPENSRDSGSRAFPAFGKDSMPSSIHSCSAVLLGAPILSLLLCLVAEELGLTHPLPNSPWRNYGDKAPLRLLSSDGFGERGTIGKYPLFLLQVCPSPYLPFLLSSPRSHSSRPKTQVNPLEPRIHFPIEVA